MLLYKNILPDTSELKAHGHFALNVGQLTGVQLPLKVMCFQILPLDDGRKFGESLTQQERSKNALSISKQIPTRCTAAKRSTVKNVS